MTTRNADYYRYSKGGLFRRLIIPVMGLTLIAGFLLLDHVRG